MLESSVHVQESPESTRQRLLEAAGEVFAEKGFREATIREICKRAGANIASINYHFGGKEHLYSDVLRYVDTMGAERHPQFTDQAKMTAEKKLEWFVLQFLKRVFDTDRPAWHERLMNREMVEPTFALDELADRNIKARSLVLQGIVREILGQGVSDQEVQRSAASVVGQCLFYWHCRPVITRIMPHVGFGPGNVDGIAGHITEFSLHALRALHEGPERNRQWKRAWAPGRGGGGGGKAMNFVALRMLMGDKAKYIGIIFGITFASMLMTQQGAIFAGLMQRTYGFVTDTSQPDVWVMDPKVQFIDDLKPLQDTMLYRVRGVEGVDWAVPMYKGLLKARLDNGSFQTCNVIGLDDATLIGGPPVMVDGLLADLRRADSVIVDENGALGKLARPAPIDPISGKPIGTPIPLKVGDYLELNDHRAVVVGICRVSRTFQSQPVVYTTYTRAVTFAPPERRLLTFVAVGAKPGLNTADLCSRITKSTGLAAYSSKDFKLLTFWYFMKFTGIPINFGISVALGFLVGTAIAGMMFYNFTVDNLKQFGALKAMGTGNLRLLGMIVLQSMVVGVIGYGLGVGLACMFGLLAGKSELAFSLLWFIPLVTGVAVIVICIAASLLSILKVIRLEPAIVFKG